MADELTTTATAPFVAPFVVALDVEWNDGGRWGLPMGRSGGYDPDLGHSPMVQTNGSSTIRRPSTPAP